MLKSRRRRDSLEPGTEADKEPKKSTSRYTSMDMLKIVLAHGKTFLGACHALING